MRLVGAQVRVDLVVTRKSQRNEKPDAGSGVRMCMHPTRETRAHTVRGICERYPTHERTKSKNCEDNTMSPADVAGRGCRYIPTWGSELEGTAGLSIKESAELVFLA